MKKNLSQIINHYFLRYSLGFKLHADFESNNLDVYQYIVPINVSCVIKLCHTMFLRVFYIEKFNVDTSNLMYMYFLQVAMEW